MPHSTPGEDGTSGSKNVETEDDDFNTALSQLLAPSDSAANEFMNRELDLGEKADNAIDYEDFEDEDLPEEEGTLEDDGRRDVTGEKEEVPTGFSDVVEEGRDAMDDLFGPDHPDGELVGDELDDLFGERTSPPAVEDSNKKDDLFMLFGEEEGSREAETGNEVAPAPGAEEPGTIPGERDETAKETTSYEDMDPATFKEYQLQQALFASAGYGPDNPPAPPENFDELLASLWPKFDRDAMPRFLELLPHKKAYHAGKVPPKAPKPVMPTKINLELAQDQERAFRSHGQPQPLKRSTDGDPSLVAVTPPAEKTEDDSNEIVQMDEDMDEVLPGGVTMQDLQFICADWDVKSMISYAEPAEPAPVKAPVQQDDVDEDYDWLFETERPTKKRKTGKDPADFLSFSHMDFPLLDDPLDSTARIAKKVQIDMNDPHLLLDERRPESPAEKTFGSLKDRGETSENLTKRLIRRYNISNDEAYDMLKENHQNKVRSTLGNAALEHSLPAVRLQWPYYKTKLAVQEARSFHRPALSFLSRVPITFSKPGFVKRKHYKGKDVKSLYDSTQSLSLADNSNVLLLEYSEEHPTMMPNFGMGSRLTNYYRKKSAEDPTRPKMDVGETAVLLPQDKSPFSVFGHVDPGETTTAVSNSMFHAPIFRQEPKNTDFLVIRNSTGVHGEHYYLRNIENLYVSGQQFPSVDVPGAQSRKVSTAAKNRLKMICYRLIRKNPHHRVSVPEISEHFPESNDLQNRQKMKEFLQFSKDHKEWEMKPGEPVPDEDVLRNYVKPDDVCLLEAMQVGQQQLHDAGYERDEDADEENEAKEGESLEQQLAPWNTTRNFLLATQGKAMLQLHGEGDPTGRGEGFSFIKTSMKGGFKAVGESVEDKLDAQKNKDQGGHSYNIARQQKAYEDAIRRIWEAQKRTLSSTIENSDEDIDMDHNEDELFGKPTPSRSERLTPVPGRRDDESTSQFSRLSTTSQTAKIMRIKRQVRNSKGQIEDAEEIVRDPRVIKQYQKLRHQAELQDLPYGHSPTNTCV